MCAFHSRGCACDELQRLYRRRRKAGEPASAAYVVAVGAFRRRHPECDAFRAMALVKDALASELEAGIVDCGRIAA